MNQKGIVWIPIIVWSIVISGSIFIAQDAVKRGYINLENLYIRKVLYSDIEPKVTPNPIPFPTPSTQPTPIPKPKISPQGQVQGITQDNQNDQQSKTRTGRIIKYKEYCKGGQEISVYENELITKKAPDGNTYAMTKDDWNCYEAKLKTFQSGNQELIDWIGPNSKTYKVTPSQKQYYDELMQRNAQLREAARMIGDTFSKQQELNRLQNEEELKQFQERLKEESKQWEANLPKVQTPSTEPFPDYSLPTPSSAPSKGCCPGGKAPLTEQDKAIWGGAQIPKSKYGVPQSIWGNH